MVGRGSGGHATCWSPPDSSGRSTSVPLGNLAPARTRATRWGALTARQRAWADSMSLNAMATPAARDPGPLVTRCRSRTVAKVDSDWCGGTPVDPMLGRVVVERQQHIDVLGDLRDRLRPTGAVVSLERFHRLQGVVACPRRCRSPRARRSRLGAQTSAGRQERRADMEPAPLLAGVVERLPQGLPKPQRPSPTASTGAVIPRRRQSRSRSAHDSVDSRYPSVNATSSLRPSVRTPSSPAGTASPAGAEPSDGYHPPRDTRNQYRTNPAPERLSPRPATARSAA